MAEVKNYAEIRFTNPIFIDIFSKFADNSVMAGIVSENGEIELRFDNTDGPIGKPSCCEHILSILYALMGSNPRDCQQTCTASQRIQHGKAFGVYG